MILFHSLPNICWLLNIFELRSIDKRESFVFLTLNVQVRKAKHTTTSLANQRTGERKAFFDRKLVNNQSKERVMKIETECKYGSGSWSVFLLGPCWEQIRPLGGYLSDSWEEHLIPHNILGPHIYSVFFHPVALSPLVKVTQAVWMQREWGKKKKKGSFISEHQQDFFCSRDMISGAGFCFMLWIWIS